MVEVEQAGDVVLALEADAGGDFTHGDPIAMEQSQGGEVKDGLGAGVAAGAVEKLAVGLGDGAVDGLGQGAVEDFAAGAD